MVRPRPGDCICPEHGIITPAMDRIVPYCPVIVGDPVDGRPCQRMASKTRINRRLRLAFVEPHPTSCRAGHPYTPGKVSLGTTGCPCARAGFHRTWMCRVEVDGPNGPVECRDEQEWPPHDPARPRAR